MCINDNVTITYIIPTITALVGVILGVILTHFSSRKLIFETRRLHALDEFVNAFTDEILFIENSPPVEKSPPTDDSPDVGYIIDPNRKFCDTLIKSRSKHRKAIEIFRFYISVKKYRKIYEAYKKYYNPLRKEDPAISFGIYNLHEDLVKSSIHRKISGKDYALENIRKIIKAAQE